MNHLIHDQGVKEIYIILGPLEMREVIRGHAKIGVDQVKLSMSGEEVRNNPVLSPSALPDT